MDLLLLFLSAAIAWRSAFEVRLGFFKPHGSLSHSFLGSCLQMGRNHRFSYPPFFYFFAVSLRPLCRSFGKTLFVHWGFLRLFFESFKHFLFVSFFLYLYYSRYFSFVKGFLKKSLGFLKKIFARDFLWLRHKRNTVKRKAPQFATLFLVNFRFFWQNAVTAQGHARVRRPPKRWQTAVLRKRVAACRGSRRYTAARAEFSSRRPTDIRRSD